MTQKKNSADVESKGPQVESGPFRRTFRGILSVAGREKLLLVVLASSFFVHVPFLLSFAFFSDESVYTYAAYAISKGVVPYGEIFLAHPPVGFLALAPVVSHGDGNLLLVRIFYLCLLLALAAISYHWFHILRKNGSWSFSPVAGAALLALYPIPFSLSTPLQFLIFDILIVQGLVFFTKGLLERSNRQFGLSGLLLGVALMDWYPAVFVGVSLVGFLLFYELRRSHRSLHIVVGHIISLVIGAAISVVTILGLVSAWAGLDNFLLQTVTLQSTIRNYVPIGVRLHHIESAVRGLLPMIVLAVAGGFEAIWRAKRAGDRLGLLPLWLLTTNFFFLSTIPRVVLDHYFDYLTPFLAYLGSVSIAKLSRALWSMRRPKTPTPPRMDFYHSVLALSMIAMVALVPYTSQYTLSFPTNPYTLAEMTVGRYVSEITEPGELVWTSEGAIAYFASRLIQAPNSSRWPFQGIYNDIFNASFLDQDGTLQTGFNLVSTSQFISAWETHATRVIVFILGSGPIPYPDEFLWYGFPGEQGVELWVTQNYELTVTFAFQDVSYLYLVWVRK